MKTWTLKRKFLLAVAILVLLIGMYPVSYSLCPEWNVTVVDEAGAALPGMTVRRSCNDYSSGNTGNEDDAITDEGGKASFTAKRAGSPVIFRWVGNILNIASQGVHASFGRHSYVFAFGRGFEGSPVVNGYIEDWNGEPEHMESRIVARPVQSIFPVKPPGER